MDINQAADLILKLGLPTAALVAIGWLSTKGVRAFWDFSKPQIESVLDEHKRFLAISSQSVQDNSEHQRVSNERHHETNETLEKIVETQSSFAKTQEKQTEMLTASHRLLEKLCETPKPPRGRK